MPRSRPIVSALIALAALCAITGCQTPGASKLGEAATGGGLTPASGFAVRWQLPLPLGENNEKVANIWRYGPRLYVASSSNRLYCVDAAAGTLYWMTQFVDIHLPIYRPVELMFDKKLDLLVMNRTQTAYYDLDTGRMLGQKPSPFAVATDPLLIGDVVCVGGADRFFRGMYNDMLATEKWRVGVPGDSFGPAPSASTDGFVFFTTVRGHAFFTSGNNAGNGWQRQTGAVAAGTATDLKNGYVASLDGKLYAFDLTSTNVVWETFLEGRLDQTPVPINKVIVCVGSGKGVYGVSAETGDQKWFVPDVTTITGHDADHVYGIDKAGTILAIGLDSGSIDGSYPFGRAIGVGKNPVDAVTYVMAPNGTLYAIEPKK